MRSLWSSHHLKSSVCIRHRPSVFVRANPLWQVPSDESREPRGSFVGRPWREMSPLGMNRGRFVAPAEELPDVVAAALPRRTRK